MQYAEGFNNLVHAAAQRGRRCYRDEYSVFGRGRILPEPALVWSESELAAGVSPFLRPFTRRLCILPAPGHLLHHTAFPNLNPARS